MNIEKQLASDPELRELYKLNKKLYDSNYASLERWAGTGFMSVGFSDEEVVLTPEEEKL